ncbi:MAG: WbqC family protein [Ekhidna sp.]
MRSLLIEPHYLGSLEYFSLIYQYDAIALEIEDTFRKQTFRNRCHFLSPNGIQQLVIPLRYSSSSKTKDVTIDYSQRWIKDHWGAFYSNYGKAPFFDFFSDSFHEIWEQRHNYLVDLSIHFLEATFKMLQMGKEILNSCDLEGVTDMRNVILTKKPYTDRKIYTPAAYNQLFGNTFVPNLSIVDLIMCEGPGASQILRASSLRD